MDYDKKRKSILSDIGIVSAKCVGNEENITG